MKEDLSLYIYISLSLFLFEQREREGNESDTGRRGIQVGRSEAIPFSDFESWNLLYPIELR